MANMTTWGSGTVSTRLSLDVPDRIVVQIDSGVSGALYLTSDEAVKLRDGLSRAIVEAAQASAKAKTVESEGSPA